MIRREKRRSPLYDCHDGVLRFSRTLHFWNGSCLEINFNEICLQSCHGVLFKKMPAKIFVFSDGHLEYLKMYKNTHHRELPHIGWTDRQPGKLYSQILYRASPRDHICTIKRKIFHLEFVLQWSCKLNVKLLDPSLRTLRHRNVSRMCSSFFFSLPMLALPWVQTFGSRATHRERVLKVVEWV